MSTTTAAPAADQTTVPTAPTKPPQQQRTNTGRNSKTNSGDRARLRDRPPLRPEYDHTISAVTALAAAGSVAYYVQAAPWWVIASGGAATIVYTAKNYHRYKTPQKIDGGRKTADEKRNDAKTPLYTFACGGAAVAYMAEAAAVSPWSPTAAGMLFGFAGILGPVYGLIRKHHTKKAVEEVQKRAEERKEYVRDKWEQMISDAGFQDVEVDRAYNDEANGWFHGTKEFPSGVSLQLVLGKKAPEFPAFVGGLSSLEKAAAGMPGCKIRSGSFQAHQPEGLANRVELTIPTGDILSRTIPADDSDTPLSIRDEIVVARAVDGTPIGVDMSANPHGLFTGMTDTGKSNFLNGHLRKATRCTDAVNLLLCGTAKARRLMRVWLRGWLKGEQEAPAPDWVAPTLDEAILMMCDVYRAIGQRQGLGGIDDIEDKWTVTDDHPRIILWMDEPNEYFESGRTFTGPDGNKHTFSTLYLEIIRLCRSEGISCMLTVQRATNQMLGMDGGAIKSQIGYRAGFRATGHIELNATFNTDTRGVALDQLPNGGLYMERKGDPRPVLAKAEFNNSTSVDYAAKNHVKYTKQRSVVDGVPGQIDQGTADCMVNYSGRWSRDNQVRFFQSLYGNQPQGSTMVADQPTSSTGGGRNEDEEFVRDTIDPDLAELWAAIDKQAARGSEQQSEQDELDQLNAMWNIPSNDANPNAAHFMAAWEQWHHENRPGEDPSNDSMQAFITNVWSNATEEERTAFLAQNDQDNAAARDDYSPDACELIELLMRANMLAGDSGGWLPAMDIEALADEHELWIDTPEGGFHDRLKRAMVDLGLTEDNQGRKRVTLGGVKRWSYNLGMLQRVARDYLG